MRVTYYTVYDCADHDNWREINRYRDVQVAEREAQDIATRTGAITCVETNLYEIDRGGKRLVSTEEDVPFFHPDVRERRALSKREG